MNIDNSCPLAHHWSTQVALGRVLRSGPHRSYSAVHPTTDTFYVYTGTAKQG
jgi:hypothetical protein